MMGPGLAPALLDHLWQTTAFVGVMAAVALALRRKCAAVRFWVWQAASLKFLLPFAWLAQVGGTLRGAGAPAAATPGWAAVQSVGQALTVPAASWPAAAAPVATAYAWWPLLAGVWAAGALLTGWAWLRSWRRVHALLQTGTRLDLGLPLPVVSAPARLEPGVFGILRPVLFLPQGIEQRLTAEQWRGLLAHEVCHARRRDNLWAALHALVQALFWFHPLVWWLGGRLVAERERACDEAVLRQGVAAEAYASSILAVCRFYLTVPGCAAGITGGGLKRRVLAIATSVGGGRLSAAGKLFLALLALAAVASPLAAGFLFAQTAPAQGAASPRFEAVSVKPVGKTTGIHVKEHSDPGHLTFVSTLHQFIVQAYTLNPQQLSGEPDWFRSDLYSIQAVTAAPTREPEMMVMLRGVLADRFHLQMHEEVRDLPAYALKLAPGEPKIHALAPGVHLEISNDDSPPGTYAHRFDSLASLVNALNGIYGGRLHMDRMVVDQTGLTGRYDMHLQTAMVASPTGGRGGVSFPNLLSDLQSQLGLELVREQVAMPCYVVVSAARPTPN